MEGWISNSLNTISLCWIVVALILIPVQLFVVAPYGRHNSSSWGINIPNRIGWMIMEVVSPAALLFGLSLVFASLRITEYVLLGLWLTHYINRTFVFPMRIRTKGKTIPLVIVLSAVFFNSMNGLLNGVAIGIGGVPATSSPIFMIGIGVFLLGFLINIISDEFLLRLRKPDEVGYKIPHGFLFRFVSCPNHLGEIIEWIGFSLACWNLPALTFAIWTAGNLIPRSLAHHRWYRTQFPDYPNDRKAVIPFLL